MADAPAAEHIRKWPADDEVLTHAAASGDERSRSALTDDEERAIFDATFRTVPAP